MKLPNFALSFLCAATLLAGCRSTQESDTTELRRELRAELTKARAELKASGATAEQLREFDRAMATMERTLGGVEKQMRALEKQLDAD